MEANPNELKIELYPDKEPRYTFKKEPLHHILPKDVFSYSFDKEKQLAYIDKNAPVLNGFYTAHTNHYPIRIKPDDIWLLIVQAFSHHVNINSEELRNMFVDFDGKKKLIVQYPLNFLSDVDKSILEDFSVQIKEQMKNFLGENLINILTPDFTTTTKDSLIICKISIMGAFKQYFDYEMDLCGCGVPYIILEGTAEDYKKIKVKTIELKKYKFEWYIDKILPHIDKMIEAKEGKIDVDYFKNMVQNKEETEYEDEGSGMGGHYYHVDHLSGWFLNFFAYYGDGEGSYFPFKEKSLKVENFDRFPSQMLTVPFKIIDVNQKEYQMKYKVGFIGCDQNQKKEVYPVTGWIVSPSTEENRESLI